MWLRDLLMLLLATQDATQGPWLRWAFGALLVLLLEAATVVVRFRRDVRLEARYRASAPTPRRWLSRRLAAACATAAVVGLLTLVCYALMDAAPRWWWVSAGVLWTVVSASVTLWAPTLAAPLVWPSVPLSRPTLAERLQGVARRAGLRALDIHEWRLDLEERRANALLVGVGPRRRVLLSTALLADYSEDEIEVIVAHELGHVVYRHLWWDLLMDTATKLIALATVAWVLQVGWTWLGLAGPSDVAGLPAALLAGGLVSLALAPLPRALSRLEERQADRYALQLTHRPDAFVSALKRLGAQHLADTRRPVLSARLYNSHPTLEARLDFARRWPEGRATSAAAR
jgi:STE24 endopeptidase